MCSSRALSSRSFPYRHSLSRSVAALAALAMLASACGAGANASERSDAVTPSPLGELLGWNEFDPVEQQRLQLEIEQLTAECMKEEGFEYIPQDYGQSNNGADEDAALYNNPEAYGQKYGYGVVHNYEQWEAANIEANETGGTVPGQDYIDPNQDYTDSLSESEREIYWETLYGKSQEWEVDDNGREIQPAPLPMEDRGCNNQANATISGPNPWEIAGFSTRFDELQQDFETDPRVLDNDDDWAACMGDSLDDYVMPGGRAASEPSDMYTYFESEKALATGQQVLPLDPKTGEPIGADNFDGNYSSSINADGTGWAFAGEQHLIAADQLEGLRTREIATWKQDFACQKKVGTADLRTQLEQEMADTLAAEFPGIGAQP